MDALAAYGKFRAQVGRVVAPVLGVLLAVGAAVALFSAQWLPAAGLAGLAGLCYLWYEWEGVVEKNKTLQQVTGGLGLVDDVTNLLDR